MFASLRPMGRLSATVLTLSCLGLPLAAQSVGRITGRIVDGGQGRPIAGAVVELVGITPARSAATGIDGRYSLGGVPAGPVTIRVRMIGFGAKVVTDIDVNAGATATQDVTLQAETVRLEELTVTAEAERGSVVHALNEQRQAVNVVNAITAEEISRGPDGDAAAAVQRVSGVTVQDGKFVQVRGLGERYTTTSLNGARIPSSEPERKVVPLDLYPAGLLAGIATAKTFTPDLPGDFSGADVDIRTKEFPTDRQITVSLGTAFNSRVTGKDLLAPRNAGREWLALASSRRGLPSLVAEAGSLSPQPSQPEVNAMVNSFRNAWSPVGATGGPGASGGISIGGNDPILGLPVGYLVSATYATDREIKSDQMRANALAGAEPGTVSEVDRYEGMTGRESVLWGGLLNLSTSPGRSRLSWNTSYNRSADNDARFEVGESENHGQSFEVNRLQYVERSALATQLQGEHQLGYRHRLEWAGALSRVTRDEPDRSEIVYQLDTDPQGTPLPPTWFSISNEGAVRTFAGLAEDSRQLSLNYRLTFGPTTRPHALKVGGLYRDTDRAAENRAYSIAGALDPESRRLRPEQIFDGRFAEPQDNFFRITPLSQGGSYHAEDRLLAGYLMVQAFLSGRVEVVGGARVEDSRVSVTTEPTIGESVLTEPSYTDVLPSIGANVSLSENHVLRFAASQTLSRPEYRELSPVAYREVIGAENILGNPDLRRALIRNFDLRWEWYPRPTEVVSLAVFAKSFADPIERIYLATSGTRLISYVNAESARNLGVELEVRKNLGLMFGESLLPWSFLANATVMNSRISIPGEGLASRTNDDRAMVGQAPFVVNAGLMYTAPRGLSASLFYNVVGRRIVSAGENPLPDVYEEARRGLDVAFRLPLFRTLSAKVDAENLLDSAFELTQGSVVKEYYRTGRKLSVGFTWSPSRP